MQTSHHILTSKLMQTFAHFYKHTASSTTNIYLSFTEWDLPDNSTNCSTTWIHYPCGLWFYKTLFKYYIVLYFVNHYIVQIQFQLITSIEINPCSIQIQIYFLKRELMQKFYISKTNRKIGNITKNAILTEILTAAKKKIIL